MSDCGLRIKDLTTVINDIGITDVSVDLLSDCSDILSSVRMLHQRQLYSDCVQIVAHALDCKDAILWGLGCLERMAFSCSQEEKGVVDNVNRWLNNGYEESRCLNRDGLDIAGSYSPVGWLSLAVFYSGGSIVEGEVVVEPSAQLFGNTVAGAVLIAACHGDEGLSQADRLPLFIDLGCQMITNRIEASYH